MNNVENIDCMIAMKAMRDKQYDLAIVDVSYGIDEGGSRNKSRSKLAVSKDYKDYGDEVCPDKEYFDELIRVSKNQIIWGANHFISKIPYDSPAWIVWDKLNGKTDFADCELAWTSFDCAVKCFRFQWQGMLQGNMKKKEIRIHPNQKPVALYKWILENYATAGNTIVDTHLGSGSSRIACYDYGFDFKGYEKSQHYYNLQEIRYDNHVAQFNLFNEEEYEPI